MVNVDFNLSYLKAASATYMHNPHDAFFICSEEVEKLARPLLHNPYILTLHDDGNDKDDIVSKNIQQYYVSTL